MVQKKAPTKLYDASFTGRSYKHYNRLDLEELLLYHDWNNFYKETDPNKQWDELVKVTVVDISNYHMVSEIRNPRFRTCVHCLF